MPPTYVSLKNGKFDTDESSRVVLDGALAGAEQSGRRLVVHFHGGLVNHAKGLEAATRLQPIYEAGGGYPLFFVWQSGLGETIVHNLGDIANEKIFKRIVAHALRFAVGKLQQKDGERGFGIAAPGLDEVYDKAFGDGKVEPYADLREVSPKPLDRDELDEIESTFAEDATIQDESAKIANSLHEPEDQALGAVRSARITGSTKTAMSPDVLEEIRQGDGGPGERSILVTGRIVKGAVATVVRTLSRLQAGRAHGVYPTVVEEVLRELYLTNAGGLIWGQMKQDTADAFGADPEVYGGTALIQGLVTHPPATTPVLVGHSTGAVYICNLLAHADAVLPKDQKFDVVLLAPACDFKLMDLTFASHGARIGRLRIFCMKDELERADQMLSIVYPRSLLYFVSGALEGEADWPILGMQRFYGDGPPFASGDFPEIKSVRDQIAKRPNSEVWSSSVDAGGLASGSKRHGDFDNDETTLESVRTFISEDSGV